MGLLLIAFAVLVSSVAPSAPHALPPEMALVGFLWILFTFWQMGRG